VVVTDYTFPTLDIEQSILAPLGCQLVPAQCKTVERLIPLVRDADVVITQFAPLRPQVIAAMERARAIVRYGIGVDNIDLDAAREHRIPVCNVSDYCIDEVADHTLAFILAATRQILPNCQYVRQGHWGLAVDMDQMRALRDLAVGIIGLGRIGREVAGRLAAFKCRRLGHDPGLSAEQIRQAGCEPLGLPDLLAGSDVVTLHCPSTARTRGMIGPAALERMKPRAILVNVARGDLVDTQALIAALRSGRLAAAALDVCNPEPIDADSPLLQMENVILASHLASVSTKAVRTLRETTAQIAARALRGQPLVNIVNGVAAARVTP
jgi:D-3-phosphoglycerate dehydrogenase